MVLQTRIFFSGQPLFSDLKKMWTYRIKPPFFLVNQFSWTTFLKPHFLNRKVEKSGCRINGPLNFVQPGSWAKLKKEQNLHQSKVMPLLSWVYLLHKSLIRKLENLADFFMIWNSIIFRSLLTWLATCEIKAFTKQYQLFIFFVEWSVCVKYQSGIPWLGYKDLQHSLFLCQF